MKIVINTTSLLNCLSGVGVYTLNLAKEFVKQRPDIDYTYFRGYFSSNLRPPGKLVEALRTLPLDSVKRFLRTALYGLSRSLRTFDVYFEPNFIPLNLRARRVVTTVHDLSIFHFPEWHPEERVEYFKRNFRRCLEISDVLVTPSRFVEEELRERFGESVRIISIPNGYDEELFFPEEKGSEKRYILFVGTLEPRKNLKNLILAYKSLPERLKEEYPLLICGPYGWKYEDLIQLIKSDFGSKIHYLGYLEGERLAKFYRGATCLVYPSFYEGFGLPPLEAMASGCPVIVSKTSSLPEVCGDSAYYVDPKDIESMREGIRRVLEDSELRELLRKKGIERAKNFSWKKSAKKYLELFESLI